MKIKAIALALFLAGAGSSYALAGNGHGNGGQGHAKHADSTSTSTSTGTTTTTEHGKAKGRTKVVLCHQAGKSGRWVKITVATKAAEKAHLKHGDVLPDANGNCPGTKGAGACSGLDQPAWFFSHAFEPFTSRF